MMILGLGCAAWVRKGNVMKKIMIEKTKENFFNINASFDLVSRK